MAKYFIFSFDDGTVYDQRFIRLLNKYHVPCTFHLNSGLEDFVWLYEDRVPIRRQKLEGTREQYWGHEVASHSLHHPLMTQLPAPRVAFEVEADCARLKEIYGMEDIGFGTPFDQLEEREIRIIKKFVRYIRIPEMAETFELPKDPYHIPIHALFNQEDIRERIAAFAENKSEDSLFVMAGHSYDCEVLGLWEWFEELLQYIRGFDFQIVTMMDFVNCCYPILRRK